LKVVDQTVCHVINKERVPSSEKITSLLAEPIAYSTGVKAAWVSGQLVWGADAETGARPNKIIHREPRLPDPHIGT
jgi:hypothetical protein